MKNIVGNKIKSLRLKLSMNTKELSQKADISSGMLSQLEKGSTQGSVETLRKIAKVLNVTIAFLFEDKSDIKSKTNEVSLIVRKDERKKISFPDSLYKCELLTPNLQGDIEFVLVELEANRTTTEMLPHTRGGEECNLVMYGTIEIQLADEHYILNEGDSIRFNPEIPHKIENKTNKKSSYISVITPPSF